MFQAFVNTFFVCGRLCGAPYSYTFCVHRNVYLIIKLSTVNVGRRDTHTRRAGYAYNSTSKFDLRPSIVLVVRHNMNKAFRRASPHAVCAMWRAIQKYAKVHLYEHADHVELKNCIQKRTVTSTTATIVSILLLRILFHLRLC